VSSAFNVLGFSQEATESVWAMVAAVLHVGNMDFRNKQDSDEVIK